MGVLHFVSEDEARQFMDIANNAGVEWTTGELKRQDRSYGLDVDVQKHSEKLLRALYNEFSTRPDKG